MKTGMDHNNLQFLAGGGEMGMLTRTKNWDNTPVGNPETWPQSLRTTLSILLNSKFPMFLFWGPQLICFYNDAYRSSLGKDGKHPKILGKPAEESWTEIWDDIKPLINQVLTKGDATWNEDQLLPIYRNGKLEDVYWTYSYSPVNDESGKPTGVFITCNETTEKVISLKRIEESNKKYINSIMQAPFAICIFRGKNHVVEIANQWMLDLWEKKEEQVMGKPIFEGLPEAKGQGLEKLMHTVYNTGEKFVANERPVSLPRNGMLEILYINFVYEPIRNSDGTITGIIAIAIDVTVQVIARKKIEENEERLNIIINASKLGIWEWDFKDDHLVYSDRYLEIFGYSSKEIINHKQFLAHLHPADKKTRDKAVNEAMETGYLHYISRIVWNDCSIHWIEANGKVLYDENGVRTKLIGTLNDITEERQNQEDLLESEQKFRLLADSLPQHIWTADTEGNLNYFNQSVFNYSGLTLEEITTDGWLQIVHPSDREENMKVWEQSISTGKDFLFEHRFRRHDGEYHWQLSRAIPQKDNNGIIQMWVGSSTDIQQQKTFAQEMESQVQKRTKELAEKNKELESMNEELKSFAYVSSHDLQEPLRKIQTFVSVVMDLEGNTLSEKGKGYLTKMEYAAERMRTLIEDLLAYSRMHSSERVFVKTNLLEILEEVKKDLKETLIEKNAIIEVHAMCDCDVIPFQFRQLINNLISNSVKFSKPGERPHIKIQSEVINGNTLNNVAQIDAKKRYCHIQITDDGIGFDPMYKAKIFEVFQRLHGKTEYSGTGIGLAIVKKIVDNHGGIILASSEINKGATFDIYIAYS